MRQATNGKARQKRQSDKLSALIDDLIVRDNLLVNRVLIITIDDFDESQKALSGLICNKLQDMYSRPVILVFKNKDNGNYYGSARSPSNIEAFLGFREFCEESHLGIYFSGHSAAFGVAITPYNIPAFQEYCNNAFSGVDMTPTFNVDFIFDAADPALPDTVLALAQFKDYWGANVEEPVIAVTNVVIDKGHFSLLSQDKNPTLKITTPSGVALMKFRSSHEEFESLLIDYDGEVE
jgi:single-stranded-DNA-specific exonuclease